jgi:hypothetical protein
MKNKLYIMLLLTLVGCSNLSKNMTEEGSFYLSNGTFAEKTWKEDLKFERYSWYQELTMQFDLMVTKISPQSSFNFWFSKDELATLNACSDARVVLAYSHDTKMIPYSSLYDQFDKSGFTRVELPEFKKQLLQHPDSIMGSLRLYHVLGFCKKSSTVNQILITFPGYPERHVK